MLKRTITYVNFDGKTVTKDLYFNITRTVLAENMALTDRFEAAQNMFEGEPRELKREEIQTVLNLVKELMRLSYGVRSADGEEFDQSPEVWEKFQKTAAYDAFLWSLFENVELANDFMIGIMPVELREQAKTLVEQMKNGVVELPESGRIGQVTAVSDDKYSKLTREQLIAQLEGRD